MYFAVAFLSVAVAAGCSSETAIHLTIQSGLRVPGEIDGLNIAIATKTKQLMDRTYPIESQDDLPATLLVVAENDAEAAVHIVVTGLKGSKSVATGETDVTFVRGETVEAVVFIRVPPPGGEDGGHGGPDGGKDAGRDASVDSGGDTGQDGGMDGAGDSGTDGGHDVEGDAGGDTGLADVFVPEDGGQDVPVDSDADAGIEDAPADDAGGDAGVDGSIDGGAWIGQPCASDADCGGGMFCALAAAGHGFCSARCDDAGCGAGARCLDVTPQDAGFLCAKECVKHSDCRRTDYGCFDLLDAGIQVCSPNQGADGGVVEYPGVVISPGFQNPAVTDEQFQFVAAMYDEEHAVVAGETFSWLSSDMNVAKAMPSLPGVFEPVEAGSAEITTLSSPHGMEGRASVEVEAVVETLAGSGASGDQDGTGAGATFNTIEHIVIDRIGNAFVTDRRLSGYLPIIRKIDPAGVVTTVAVPTSHPACIDGPTSGPVGWGVITGMSIDQVTGDVFFSDTECNGIRKISQDTVSTLFKTAKGFADGGPGVGRVDGPGVLKFVPNAIVFFDTNNHRIRSVSLPDLAITTLAGSSAQGYKDGPATEAELDDVQGLDAIPDGVVYFTDFSRHVVRVLEPGGVRTIAGRGQKGFKDGPTDQALFEKPNGIIFYREQLYITESGNHRIRRIRGDDVSTLACDWASELVDGKKSACALFYPLKSGVAADGLFVITDSSNYAIRTLQLKK